MIKVVFNFFFFFAHTSLSLLKAGTVKTKICPYEVYIPVKSINNKL